MKSLNPVRFGIALGLGLFWLAVCFLVAAVLLQTRKAHAQPAGGVVWSERSSAQPQGEFQWLYNVTGSTILAGTVVMADTIGTTVQPQIPLGKGIRTWDHNPNNVRRVVGVTLNDCPGYSGTRVLVAGWTNHVLMAATGVAAMTYLRPSFSVDGALAAYSSASDSANTAKRIVGQFQRYESATSLYGYAKVDFRAIGQSVLKP